MKKFILFILLYTCSNVCIAQTPKDVVYLYFDASSKEMCENKNGQDYKKFNKQEIAGVLVFKICNQEFGFEIKEGIKGTISLDQEKTINYSDIDYLIQVFKDTEPTKYKHNIFDKIYIIERTSEGSFIKYEAGWIDENLWIKN